ncbi:MAG: AI-2E family transporter [Burkholderiales bacterium PBB3]|nr:MAG: AI-2E family transporter [Burkholderiales bacterium PBB3]
MTPTDPTSAGRADKRALLVLLIGISLALGWILLPFYGAILWGFIIALLATPLQRWLLPRLRFQRNRAALLTMLVVLVVVVLPFVLITVSIATEASGMYQRMQSGELNPARYLRGVFDALPDWVGSVLDRFGLTNFDKLQARVSALLSQGTQFIATQALSMGQFTFDFVANLFITLYLAFFLIRDGDSVLRLMRQGIPLSDAHKRELWIKFTTVIRATVKGNLLVAGLQGALGGVAFWVLGIGAPVLWAVLMAFLSLLPAVGAGLVWVPVAVYLLLQGALWQSLALIAWGVLVIGLIDNVLRPMLVGKDTRMPDYVVLITTLGGMAVMGINGFVVGPTIAAMFMAVWHIYASPSDAEPPSGAEENDS